MTSATLGRHICTAVLTAFLVAAPRADTFTDELWVENADMYAAILDHPFLQGMQDGTLDPDIFAFYIVQDAKYLDAFATALRAAAAKAPNPDWVELLTADAEDSLDEERRLHEQVFGELGITGAAAADTEATPEAFGYMSFLVATAYDRPFEEAIAALLPCYWIYWEVGKAMQANGSPHPTYQAWIDTYVSEGYGQSVRAVQDMVNAMASGANAEQRTRMRELFRRSSRYEWMFWDAAYHRRGWPPN